MSLTMNKIVEQAAEKRASDLHVILGQPIKCRIDGKIVNFTDEIITSEQIEAFARELIGEKYDQISSIGEADVGFTFPCGIRVRGNVYRQSRKLAIALRIFPNKIPQIEELGLPECVEQIPLMNNGIVLVTGETGAGKSTTLAAILDRINHTKPAHVITLEDPIEYVFDNDKCIMTQREIAVDTESYKSGLRSILREDPDIIMIGEMRDYETIEAALTAAETGHLVLATLHTNSAADTLDRILGVFPEHAQAQVRMQLSNTICCILCQKLLPHKNGEGRVLACEAMIANPAIRTLIREGKTHQVETYLGIDSANGSVLMDNSLYNLVQEGKLSIEVAERYVKRKEILNQKLTNEEQTVEKGFFGKRK